MSNRLEIIRQLQRSGEYTNTVAVSAQATRDDRDELIVAAARAGLGVREIARHLGTISYAQVSRILTRFGLSPGRPSKSTQMHTACSDPLDST